MENTTWDFLRASRFWVMMLGAFAVYAEAKLWIGEPEMVLVATISAIFIGVKTIDRISDKKVEVADIAANSNTIVFEK